MFVHFSRFACNNLTVTNNTTSQYGSTSNFEQQKDALRTATECEPLKQPDSRRQTHLSCQQELCESCYMFALRVVFLHHLLPLLGMVLNEEFGSFSDVALLRLGAFAAFRLESVQQDFCSNRRKMSVLDVVLQTADNRARKAWSANLYGPARSERRGYFDLVS